MKRGSFKVYVVIIKSLLCIAIFLGLAIVGKSNYKYRTKIHYYLYEDKINFSLYKKIYNKYLGGVFYWRDDFSNSVFNEKIKYSKASSYEDGVVLFVENKYLVPSISEGIVVYLGEKDKYGSVVMIEDNDGVATWYGNICNSSLKLYDNISQGAYVGESCDDKIYLVFSKNNSFLDYKKYLP